MLTVSDESVFELDEPESEDTATDHLTDLPDGAGCTEIWEHLGRQRVANEAEGDGDADQTVGGEDGRDSDG